MTEKNPREPLDTSLELCHNCRSGPTASTVFDSSSARFCATYTCPVCGVSINPQPTILEAIQTWNQKQRYLQSRDDCERESPDGSNPVYIGYCSVSQEF